MKIRKLFRFGIGKRKTRKSANHFPSITLHAARLFEVIAQNFPATDAKITADEAMGLIVNTVKPMVRSAFGRFKDDPPETTQAEDGNEADGGGGVHE